MSLRPAQRIVASVRRVLSPRAVLAAQAAREALALCATFNAIGEEAAAHLDDGTHFADLLAQRDDVLALLNEHLLVLRRDRPTADGPEYSGAERAADTADDLVLRVQETLEASAAGTAVLTARVAERAAELRQEIAAVNTAGSAQHAYAPATPAHHVDSRR